MGRFAFGRILGQEASAGRKPWFVDVRKDEESQGAFAALPMHARVAYRRLGLSMHGNVVEEGWTKEEAIARVARKTGVPEGLLEATGSS